MIQRIQSVYLLLAAVFFSVSLFTPLARFFAEAEKWITLTGMGYEAINMDDPARWPYGVIVLTALGIVLPLYSIFGYKNRKSQVKKVNFCIFVEVLWYVAYAAYAYSFSARTGLQLQVEACAGLPLLAMIATIMARKAIKRDEALVRAADRIR